MKLLVCATALVMAPGSSVAFQPQKIVTRPVTSNPFAVSHTPVPASSSDFPTLFRPQTSLSARNERDDGEDGKRPSLRRRIFQRIAARVLSIEKRSSRLAPLLAKIILPLVVIFPVASLPQPAEASAPVMAIPKQKEDDPIEMALDQERRARAAKTKAEIAEFTATARRIEAEQGEAARIKFEREYKAEKERKAAESKDKIPKAQRNMLVEEGICPFTDMDGIRNLFLLENNVDLFKVEGTKFYAEGLFKERDPKKSFAVQKQYHRRVIKAMAQDLENRGEDPVEYFERHQEQTTRLLRKPIQEIGPLMQQYEANIEEYGQLTPPKEGEMSAKERLAAEAKKGGNDKAEAKRLKAEAKAIKAAERAAAKEAKAQAKAEAKAAKLRAKQEKTAKAAAATMAEDVEEDAIVEGEEEDYAVAEVEEPAPVSVEKKSDSKLPIVPVTAFVAATGGGFIAFKKMRDNSATAEEERKRQMRILLGDEDKKPSAPALEVVDADVDDDDEEDDILEDDEEDEEEEEPEPAPAPVVKKVEEAPKKKRRGLKSVFGRKKNDRETNINNLISGSTATAPEFAKLLAKILTFGAPGRFPTVENLPGEMPMKSFELEPALQMLTEAQGDAGITKEQSAEIFANVVNCMLIDIVDLASSTLKEKDNQITVDAIAIVVDFMNHAASLYNSIAEGVTIKPVTYGGDLSKSKLEQMYGTYASSGVTNLSGMDADFESRVELLQDVFDINAKKAEGIMMKTMQKSMMEMMKSGEGMEGMEEMMKKMGGIEGLGGMPGMDGQEEPDPEKLKEMLIGLKGLKDSGMIPDAEMEEVKKQFRDSFGSSIEDVMTTADSQEEVSDTEKEIIVLLKEILE